MREEDRVHGKWFQPGKGIASRAQILAPVGVRWPQRASVVAPQRVAAEQEPIAFPKEAHAPCGMAGRVDDAKTAQHRQEIAVGKIGGHGKPTQTPGERTRVQPPGAKTICRVQQDLGSEGAADVIRMSVGHDEAADLMRGSSKGRDRGMKARKRTAHARIDDRDVVLEDREGRRADQRYRKDAISDLSRR